MKRKVIFGVMSILCCAIFFGVVHCIEKEQQKVKKMSDISSEMLQENSHNAETLQGIMSREDFGEFIELTTSIEQKVTGKELGEANYIYSSQEKISEFTDILESYQYYPAEVADSLIERMEEYVVVELVGENEIVFNICFYKIPDVEDVMFANLWGDDLGGTMTNGMSSRWHDVYRYVDVAMIEKLIEWIDQNTPVMSLELAEEKIQSVKATGDMMPRAEFFSSKTEQYEKYRDFENSHNYTVCIQPLSDYEGYLKLYVFSIGWSSDEDIGCLRYIFKIELYNADGTFAKELYNDVERYDKDRMEHL